MLDLDISSASGTSAAQARDLPNIEQLGMIAAVSLPRWVIGINDRPEGSIPWHHREDLQRFKRLTTGHTIIMGRRTFESIGRPLPKRRNLVISSTMASAEGVEVFASLEEALVVCEGQVWLIGGARIYEAGMKHADLIDITIVPEKIDADDITRFPTIDPSVFEAGPDQPYDEAPHLIRRIYRRR